MQLSELKARVLLNMIPEIGVIRANKLIAYFGSASKMFESNKDEVASAGEFSGQLAVKILRSLNEIDADKELQKAGEMGISILVPDDKAYPQQLRTLQDFPVVLYVKGAILNDDVYSVAIVGTRKPTEYGKLVTEKLSREFIKLGVTIVSGLARGVDTIAHTQAVNAGGRTIAVLGNGMQYHYPPENAKLEDKISKCGAVVSEFPLSFQPEKFNFPRRNRLIAGLSLGTIVIEGSDKSGSLITAKYAAEQGKDVFAVPGSIFSRNTDAPHLLIRQGAKLVSKAEDVIEEIAPLGDWLKETLKMQEQQDNPAEELKLLSKTEERILEALDNIPDGINIDKLQRALDCGFGELSEALISLELKQRLKTLPGKVYIKI